jgi:hypothetical protein
VQKTRPCGLGHRVRPLEVVGFDLQHATAERNQAIAVVRIDCAIGVPWRDTVEAATETYITAYLRLQKEAAGGIEPPYGALQAPA